MTTKIVPRSSLMNNQEINGSVENPEIFPLDHGGITRAAIADHGKFAVFQYSSPSRFGPNIQYKSIIINEESPTLDLEKEGIYLDSAYQKFEFTKGSKGGKERG